MRIKRKEIEKILDKHKLSEGLLLSIVSGEMLDRYGANKGITRKKWFIFKESDQSYKDRIVVAELVKRGYIDATE